MRRLPRGRALHGCGGLRRGRGGACTLCRKRPVIAGGACVPVGECPVAGEAGCARCPDREFLRDGACERLRRPTRAHCKCAAGAGGSVDGATPYDCQLAGRSPALSLVASGTLTVATARTFANIVRGAAAATVSGAGSLTFAWLATDVVTVVVDVPVVITALVLGTGRVTVRKAATVGSVSAGSGVLPLFAEATQLDVRLEAVSGTLLGQRGGTVAFTAASGVGFLVKKDGDDALTGGEGAGGVAPRLVWGRRGGHGAAGDGRRSCCPCVQRGCCNRRGVRDCKAAVGRNCAVRGNDHDLCFACSPGHATTLSAYRECGPGVVRCGVAFVPLLYADGYVMDGGASRSGSAGSLARRCARRA